MISRFIDWLFKDSGRYVQKCSGDRHYGKIITPTLGRRVISVDAPCQCGLYKSHKDFMGKQFEILNENGANWED